MAKLKIVHSRTLAEPHSARTRIEREFEPDAVRRLKANADHDIAVDGPELAAHAIRAGLVDEFQMIILKARLPITRLPAPTQHCLHVNSERLPSISIPLPPQDFSHARQANSLGKSSEEEPRAS
jgi:dihydrofolate reductase